VLIMARDDIVLGGLVAYLATARPTVMAPIELAGITLPIAWIRLLPETMRSPVCDGVLLAPALFGVLASVAEWHGWLSRQNTRALVSDAFVIAAAILSIGLSGSHIRQRRSGQADVDEVDER
jgi:hypothetical protein